jgi:hypothetical protein
LKKQLSMTAFKEVTMLEAVINGMSRLKLVVFASFSAQHQNFLLLRFTCMACHVSHSRSEGAVIRSSMPVGSW